MNSVRRNPDPSHYSDPNMNSVYPPAEEGGAVDYSPPDFEASPPDKPPQGRAKSSAKVLLWGALMALTVVLSLRVLKRWI